MKILVSSTGPGLDSTIDPRFGRAPYFLVIDSGSGKLLESIANTAADTAQGAGISAAAMAAEKGIQKIYTGRLGPKAMAVIERAGIELVEGVNGRVDTMLETACSAGSDRVKTAVQDGPGSGIGPGNERCRRGGQGRGRGGHGTGSGPCRRS